MVYVNHQNHITDINTTCCKFCVHTFIHATRFFNCIYLRFLFISKLFRCYPFSKIHKLVILLIHKNKYNYLTRFTRRSRWTGWSNWSRKTICTSVSFIPGQSIDPWFPIVTMVACVTLQSWWSPFTLITLFTLKICTA